MENSETKLSFYAPVYIEKSTDDGDIIDVKMHMVISDPTKDFSGDEITPDMLDTTALEKSGRITWEHKAGPDKIIGNVLGVFQIGDRTEMVANILAKKGTEQYKAAKSCVDLEENTRIHNQRYPNNPKTFGCSVDGVGYKDKRTGKLLKVFVHDVAMSTKPQHPKALAAVMKSFAAGYESNPTAMSGSQAGRTENLQGKSKNLNIEVTRMKFTNKAECKKYLVEKCFMSDDMANKKADEWEAAQNESTARTEKVTKSIGNIDAAIKAINDRVIGATEVDAKVVAIGKSLSDAALPPSGSTEIDPVAFLKSIGSSNVEHMNLTKAGVRELAGISVIQLQSNKEILEVMKSISQEIADIRGEVVSSSNNTELLTAKLDEVEKGITTNPEILRKLQEEEDKKNGGGDKNAKKYAPTVVMEAFNKSIGATTDPVEIEKLSFQRSMFEMNGKEYANIPDVIKTKLQPHLPAEA